MTKEVSLKLSTALATTAYEILQEFKTANSGSSNEKSLKKMVRDCEKIMEEIESATLSLEPVKKEEDTNDKG